MERKQEQLQEVKAAVETFILQLFEKDIIGFVEELDEMRPLLEDFVFSQIEEARASLLSRVRERIVGQIDEEER